MSSTLITNDHMVVSHTQRLQQRRPPRLFRVLYTREYSIKTRHSINSRPTLFYSTTPSRQQHQSPIESVSTPSRITGLNYLEVLPELPLDGQSDVAQARQDHRLDIPVQVLLRSRARNNDQIDEMPAKRAPQVEYTQEASRETQRQRQRQESRKKQRHQIKAFCFPS